MIMCYTPRINEVECVICTEGIRLAGFLNTCLHEAQDTSRKKFGVFI